MTDNINPSHYKGNGMESIDVIEAFLPKEQVIGFLRGNIIKYQLRYKNKGGVEDLKKQQWYTNKLIEVEMSNEPVSNKHGKPGHFIEM